MDPVRVTSPLDGTGRLFVSERGGRIRVFNQATGTIASEPFLDLRGAANGRGVALAFNPTWTTAPLAYVSYTGLDNRLHVVRYRPYGSDPAKNLDPATATHLMTIPGGLSGDLIFGGDGLLYIGTGSRPYSDAADLKSMHGKVLRVNPGCGTYVYCIPAPTTPSPGARPGSGARSGCGACRTRSGSPATASTPTYGSAITA